MLHFAPEQPFDIAPEPYAEAVARLASIRHALRLVDPNGGGPAPDPVDDERIGAAWNSASKAATRCFDARSGRVIAGTAAGLEALIAERAAGREPNEAASRQIADQIRSGLEDVARLILGPTQRPARPGRLGADHFPLAL